MTKHLTLDDFAPHLRKTFEVDYSEAKVPLTLEKVQELPTRVRESGSFRLEFRGPLEPILPQAIYGFEIEGEVQDVFIVPIGQDAESTIYEAIFN
jgi:hypothetical protein